MQRVDFPTPPFMLIRATFLAILERSLDWSGLVPFSPDQAVLARVVLAKLCAAWREKQPSLGHLRERSGTSICDSDSPNDSPVFRSDFQWAARSHTPWSRRNSGPSDETSRRLPSLRRPVGSQVAIVGVSPLDGPSFLGALS